MQRFVKFGLFVVLALGLGLLSACDGTQTTDIDSCIIGIWEIDDAAMYSLAVLPPGSFSPQDVSYVRGDPELAYKFDPDGKVSVMAVDWKSYNDVDTIYGMMALDMTINGLAEGRFSVDKDIVTVYLVTASAMEHRANLAGEEMFNSQDVKEFLPLFVPPYNTARFQCVGEQLVIDISNRPGIRLTLQKAE